MLAQGDRLSEIPGIGEDLAAKIKEILATGACQHYEKLKKDVPEGVVRMLEIPSVGPKTAKLFYDRLKISSVEKLYEAARKGRLLGLPGIKEKTVENILKGIELLKKGKERMDLLTATKVADEIVEFLNKDRSVQKITVAGSLRRMKETVRDIDILVVSNNPRKASRDFVGLTQVKQYWPREKQSPPF